MQQRETFQSAYEQIAAFLKPYYPDFSGFTIVALDDRSRDAIHYYLHTNLGGLMPTIVPFKTYKQRLIAAKNGFSPLDDDEAFLRFHLLYCEMSKQKPTPDDSAQSFSFLQTACRFSVSREEMVRHERITEEQRDRISLLFSLRERFRASLAKAGLFYLPFEENVIGDHTPSEHTLFVGLPLMTPIHERFLTTISPERLFISEVQFGPFFPPEKPEYETAFSLAVTHRFPIIRDTEGRKLSFSEVPDRASLAAIIAEEVNTFRGTRKNREQMAVVLLDEELAFYLWRTFFAALGDEVNFSPWIPFRHFGVAHRLVLAIREKEDLSSLRTSFVTEVASLWRTLDRAERTAYEKAITLCDELQRLRALMASDEEWEPIAIYLIENQHLHLTGDRTAPIQVLGFGEIGGTFFTRALIAPMDRGIFPYKPLAGPFLNFILAPHIHRARFEAEDMLLRQFLVRCEKVHIVARYDLVNGYTPSPHFAFLATEWGKKPEECRLAPELFATPSLPPSIVSSPSLRESLQNFSWSYSGLNDFFHCPFRFFFSHLPPYRVELPPFLEDSAETLEKHLGSVLHKWNTKLKRKTAIQRVWRNLFEETWFEESPSKESPLFTLREVYKPILLSYLEDAATAEQEMGTSVLFSEEILETELHLTGTFGSGRYCLVGYIDRIQRDGAGILILDLKYKDPQHLTVPKKKDLCEYLSSRGYLSDAHQLIIYTYLLRNTFFSNGKEKDMPLSASFFAIKAREYSQAIVRLSEEEIMQTPTIMDQIATLLDERIEQDRFLPNYESKMCCYCLFQPLCGHPDYLSQ